MRLGVKVIDLAVATFGVLRVSCMDTQSVIVSVETELSPNQPLFIGITGTGTCQSEKMEGVFANFTE